MEDPKFTSINASIKADLMRIRAERKHEDFEWVQYLQKRINGLFASKFNDKKFNEPRGWEFWHYRMALLTTLIASVEKGFDRKMEATKLTDAIKEKPLQGLKVLELGFGGSVEAEQRPALYCLAELGATTYGAEIDQKSVDIAKSNLKEPLHDRYKDASGNPVINASQIRQGGIEDLPKIFPDEKFDVVCSDAVFAHNPLAGTAEHIFDKEFKDAKAREWMAKISAVLKNGGLAVHVNMDDAYFPSPEFIESCGYKILSLNERIEGEILTNDYSVFMKVG